MRVATYVHLTENCRSDATGYTNLDLVERIAATVRSSQALTGFEPLGPLLKKGLGRSFRLVARSYPFGDDELVLFLRVLTRSGGSQALYDAMKRNEAIGSWPIHEPYDPPALQGIYRTLSASSPEPPLPAPDDEERLWLYEALKDKRLNQDELAEDLLVLETDTWVTKIGEESNRDFLAKFHDAASDLCVSVSRGSSDDVDDGVFLQDGARVGIAYAYRARAKRLILIEPVRSGDDLNIVRERSRALLEKGGDTGEDLAKIASRAYPAFMILDQDAWLAIQKEEDANIALSLEEADLLRSVRAKGAAGELGFPLFINGRAGSGKSTMLQYLAADYIDFGLRRSSSLHAVYLTSSNDLRERARTTVGALLTTQYERLLAPPHDREAIDAALGDSFRVFHGFLRSLLPEEQRARMPVGKYVNYAVFRQLWLVGFGRRPEARRISPDIAWHTIRSYIKGRRDSLDDELDPEEFSLLPRGQHSVTEETYQRVFTLVWNGWYKPLCEEQGYWDDQDLAAAVLETGAARHARYAAVFCDEAQDFTPIELEIIFQLSLFSQRSLRPEDLRRVPIAFAGDPLQTINPTGFRWDAVKADFRERFLAVVERRRQTGIDLSYHELHFNYRSNPGIVSFCNLIQLVRAALLGDRLAQPQRAWWIRKPAQTLWYPADDEQTRRQLLRRVDLVKIINKDEGEEPAYVRGDPILKDLKEESDGVFRNVLVPTRAKGLEFETVVLYRFGDDAPSTFADVLAGTLVVENDPEARIPLEYFLNRLYVGASRARDQLFIVDSTQAFARFWKFATSPDVLEKLLLRVRDSAAWREAVEAKAMLLRGDEHSWASGRVDEREQARQYAQLGERQRDPWLMQQAAAAYRGAGDEFEAARTYALALEFERRFEDAGNRYRDAGFLRDAFRCFWDGRSWSRVVALAPRDISIAADIKSRAAAFMAEGAQPDAVFLDVLATEMESAAWRKEVAADDSWRHVLDEVGERLSRAPAGSGIPWERLYAGCRQLSGVGYRLPESALAVFAFRAGDHPTAVQLWDVARTTESPDYARAKVELTHFPERIMWMARLGDRQGILDEWLSANLDPEAIARVDAAAFGHVVESALSTPPDLPLACELLKARPETKYLAMLLDAAAAAGEVGAALTAAQALVRAMVSSRSWPALIRAAERCDFSGFVSGRAKDRVTRLLEQGAGRAEVFVAAISALARSPELAADSVGRQAVVDFLNRTLLQHATRAGFPPVDPMLAGAAIERAGRIVDALQFYEELAARPLAPAATKRFAKERLIRNLERRARYQRDRGQEAEARQQDSRVAKLRKDLRLADVELTEYPALPTVGSGGKRTPATRHGAGPQPPYSASYSRPHNRLRIQNADRDELVTLYATSRQLTGDPPVLEVARDDDAVEWRVPDWDVHVRLVTSGAGSTVVVEGAASFEMRLV